MQMGNDLDDRCKFITREDVINWQIRINSLVMTCLWSETTKPELNSYKQQLVIKYSIHVETQVFPDSWWEVNDFYYRGNG